MSRILALLLLGLIMPEAVRLCWRLNMPMELPEPLILIPVPASEWQA
jgi:hypothetical protein